MSWSSFIRAVGGKRHPQDVLADRSGTDGHMEPVRAHRTMMGIDVSPVHGRHCICDRCTMLTARIRIDDAA